MRVRATGKQAPPGNAKADIRQENPGIQPVYSYLEKESRIARMMTEAADSRFGSSGGESRVHRIAFAAACAVSLPLLVFLYTWRLEQSPPYLNQDEAGMGLASYLLATTGRDFTGAVLPVFVACFDEPDLNPAMLSYWAIPFVRLAGLSVLSLRASAAVLGLLTVLLFGIVSWRATANRWATVAAVWLLGLTPLFFIQSRLFMQLLAITFVIAWLGCINEFERTRDQRFMLAAALVLGLGFYSYTTTRVLMPIYLGVTLLVYRLSAGCSWRTAGAAAAVFGALMIPVAAFASLNPELFQSRFRSLSWWKDGMPLTTAAANYISYYLSHFDPVDLFVSGDGSLVHSTGRAGVFLRSTAPFAAIGAASLLTRALRQRCRLSILILLSLLLSPVPTALLAELHRPYRALYVVAPYSMVCLAGIQAVVARAKGSLLAKSLLAGLVILWAGEAGMFLQDYYSEYPTRAVAAGYFNGNKPLAFRTVMQSDTEEIYVDREDITTSTYVLFFRTAYGYRGATQLVQPADSDAIAGGALLLTRRAKEYGKDFEEVGAIPEIAPNVPTYSIMRKRGSPANR